MKTEEKKAQHAKGEFYIDLYGPLKDQDTYSIGPLGYTQGVARVRGLENARRLKAAWNACDSIPTEALENGVVGELLEALEDLLKAERSHETTPGGELKTLLWISQSKLARISTIIASAKGAP